MASDLKILITERFVKGIRRSFTPCPLIGPKWLQEYPNGRPADYRFFGIRKLAKAIGQPADKILKTVLKNTSFKGLDVDVEITGGIYVDIFVKGKQRAIPGDQDQPPQESDAQRKPRRRSRRRFPFLREPEAQESAEPSV